MYACPGLYMPWVGSRQASLNKLIWCTLMCYMLCSGDKIYYYLSFNIPIPADVYCLNYKSY